MIAHARGCVRGDWLIARPKLGLFWTVLFQEGPPCDCPAGSGLFSSEQSPGRDGSGSSGAHRGEFAGQDVA